MPSIAMFYGVVIYIYSEDHNPPHFHAVYQSFQAVFDFDGNLIEGAFPQKQMRLVSAWAILHQDELQANWDLASNGETPYKIEPLR